MTGFGVTYSEDRPPAPPHVVAFASLCREPLALASFGIRLGVSAGGGIDAGG